MHFVHSYSTDARCLLCSCSHIRLNLIFVNGRHHHRGPFPTNDINYWQNLQFLTFHIYSFLHGGCILTQVQLCIDVARCILGWGKLTVMYIYIIQSVLKLENVEQG